MGTVAVYLVVEGMIYGDLVVAVVVDGVRKQLEANAVSCAIITARVPPGCRDEEVGMDRFVK